MEHKVETYFVDFRPAFLEAKLDWIKGRAFDPQAIKMKNVPSNFSEYQLAELINLIQASPECDLNQELLLRNLIDYQWNVTKRCQTIIFAFYIIGYLVPFFWQVYENDQDTILMCNISCFITLSFLSLYELLQYRRTSFADYFSDGWNKADVAHYVLYLCCYFWLRVCCSEGSVRDFFEFERKTPPWNEDYPWVFAIRYTLTWANCILLILVVIKLLNFLRIIEEFGLFILLLRQCISDIKLFFLFQILWICIFAMMLYILKSDIPNYHDYPHLYWWLQQLIQSWRNALGDLQPPFYEQYWLKKYEYFEELEKTHRLTHGLGTPINVIIGFLWAIWLITTIFN